jgi:hypothetical protein
MRLLAGLCCLMLLGFAVYRTLRLGYADMLVRPRVAAMQRAVALDPDNSQFRALLAETLEQEGSNGAPEMEAAIALNPWDAQARIRLGLMLEAAGDLGRAERSLLSAAGFNRQYAPSWALANFYFRRQDEARFWPWARRAFLMAYDDCAPLFRLCWNVTTDSGRILQTAIPDRRNVLAQFLAFLLDRNQIAGGQAAAERLVPLAESNDTGILLRYCERAIGGGLAAPSVAVWNRMCERRLVRFDPLQPGRGLSLTNPTFRRPFLEQCFDWRVTAPAEVSVFELSDAGGLKVAFSGRQPEEFEILTQYMPVEPGRRYRIEFEYRTDDIPPGSGLGWLVVPAPGGGQPAGRSPALSSPEWRWERFEFSAAPGETILRLVLQYRRAPGTTRGEGWLLLRRVECGLAG